VIIFPDALNGFAVFFWLTIRIEALCSKLQSASGF